MNTTICPRCGTENPVESKICLHCQTNLIYAIEHPEEVEKIPQPNRELAARKSVQQISQKKKRKFSDGQVFAIGCFTILIIIACVWGAITGADSLRGSNDIGRAVSSAVSSTLQVLMGGIGLVLIMLCATSPLTLWLWALVDCIKNEPNTGNDKIVWILIIIFTSIMGAMLYLLIRRPQRIANKS